MTNEIARVVGWLLILGVSFAAEIGTALADTDYRCLNDCLNRGDSAGGKCLASCTYQRIESISRPSPEFGAAHNQFNAPLPANEMTVLPPVVRPQGPVGAPKGGLSPTTQPLGPSTNYTCVNGCTVKGYQHDLCVESCSY